MVFLLHTPRFSYSLGLFPLSIFLSSSYLEASNPFFLLSDSKAFITFGLPSRHTFLITTVFFSFWLNQPHSSSAPLTAASLPALPDFQLIICLLPVLPQPANTPTFTFRVCSYRSLSLYLPYFLLNLHFLPVDSSFISFYNKNGHIIVSTLVCKHEEIGTADNTISQLTVPESPRSEEEISQDWIILSMTLIFCHIETHRKSFLHLFPMKKTVFSAEKSIQIDNHQKTAEEPQSNSACVIPKDTLVEHIFWSEKHATTLYWLLNSKNDTFSILLACFNDLLIDPAVFLKHLGHTDMIPNYLTDTGLKLEVSNWHFIQ